MDNNIRKNNLSMKGLKEGVEGTSLLVFLEELFTSFLGYFAHRIGYQGRRPNVEMY